MHVAHREDMDEAANERDNNQHDCSDAIKVKAHREGNTTERKPLNSMRFWIGDYRLQEQKRADECDEHRCCG